MAISLLLQRVCPSAEPFQIDPADVPGRQLSELGAGEWGLPQLTSLLKATASESAEIAAYEIDLIRQGEEPRYLVVYPSDQL
jgi:hypothetical protein